MSKDRRWLTVPADPQIRSWLRSVVRQEPAAISVASLNDATWQATMAAVRRHCLTGLAFQTIASDSTAPVDRLVELRNAHRDSSVWDLQVESMIPMVHELFRKAGIDWRVLKGVATARLWYREPGLRHTSDLDILVHPADFTEATRLLRTVCPGMVELRGPICQATFKEATVIHGSGVEIDLHQWVGGAVPAIAYSDTTWWDQPQQIAISGVIVHTPPEWALVFNLIAHLGCCNAPLTSVADFSRALGRPNIDWEWVFERAFTPRLAAMSGWAMLRTSDWLEVNPFGQLQSTGGRRLPEGVLGWALTSHAPLNMLRHLTTPRRAARFVESVFPSHAYRTSQQC